MHQELKKEIGKRIKELRIERRLNQTALAKACNCTNSKISKIETGDYDSLTVDDIKSIADKLGGSMAYLLGETDSKTRGSDLTLQNIVKTITCGLLRILPEEERKNLIQDFHLMKWR